jgi:hypothetical protein
MSQGLGVRLTPMKKWNCGSRYVSVNESRKYLEQRLQKEIVILDRSSSNFNR